MNYFEQPSSSRNDFVEAFEIFLNQIRSDYGQRTSKSIFSINLGVQIHLKIFDKLNDKFGTSFYAKRIL